MRSDTLTKAVIAAASFLAAVPGENRGRLFPANEDPLVQEQPGAHDVKANLQAQPLAGTRFKPFFYHHDVLGGGPFLVDPNERRIVRDLGHTLRSQESFELDASGTRLLMLRVTGELEIQDAWTGAVQRRLRLESGDPAPAHRRSGGYLDDDRVMVHFGKSTLEVWSLASERMVARLSMGPDSVISTIETSGDRSSIALGDESGRVQVWSTRDWTTTHGPFQGPSPPGPKDPQNPPSASGKISASGGVWDLAFSPHGDRLAAGCGDELVRCWNLRQPGEPVLLSYADENLFGDLGVGGVQFSADGTRLYTLSSPFWLLRAWDLESRKVAWEFHVQGGNASCPRPALARDGRTVLFPPGGRLLDALDGSLVANLAGEASPAQVFYQSNGELAWGPESSRLVVYSMETRQRLFDLEIPSQTGQPASNPPR